MHPVLTASLASSSKGPTAERQVTGASAKDETAAGSTLKGSEAETEKAFSEVWNELPGHKVPAPDAVELSPRHPEAITSADTEQTGAAGLDGKPTPDPEGYEPLAKPADADAPESAGPRAETDRPDQGPARLDRPSQQPSVSAAGKLTSPSLLHVGTTAFSKKPSAAIPASQALGVPATNVATAPGFEARQLPSGLAATPLSGQSPSSPQVPLLLNGRGSERAKAERIAEPAPLLPGKDASKVEQLSQTPSETRVFMAQQHILNGFDKNAHKPSVRASAPPLPVQGNQANPATEVARLQASVPAPASAQAPSLTPVEAEVISVSINEVEAPSPMRAETTNSQTTSSQNIPGRMELAQGAARQIAEALQNLPGRPVEISLSPEELGRVRLALTSSEAGIVVSVFAERAETIDLMRRHINTLETAFSAIGYNDISFTFAGGQDAPTQADIEEGLTSVDEATPDAFGGQAETVQIALNTAAPTGLDLRL